MESSSIAQNLININAQITDIAARHNRNPNHIQLLAVSKTKPVSDIITAYESGQRIFGENYVQEGVDKINELSAYKDVLWHFIGPLQSNKSKFVAENFDWMHSVDRLKIVKRLHDQRSPHKKPLNICVQINIDDEDSKAGISANEAVDFIAEVQKFERIKCRGLMTIPKADVPEAKRRTSFAKMQQLFLQCTEKFEQFDTLSMGMSGDLDLAIEYGSTMVRVGTAIFGSRQ